MPARLRSILRPRVAVAAVLAVTAGGEVAEEAVGETGGEEQQDGQLTVVEEERGVPMEVPAVEGPDECPEEAPSTDDGHESELHDAAVAAVAPHAAKRWQSTLTASGAEA